MFLPKKCVCFLEKRVSSQQNQSHTPRSVPREALLAFRCIVLCGNGWRSDEKVRDIHQFEIFPKKMKKGTVNPIGLFENDSIRFESTRSSRFESSRVETSWDFFDSCPSLFGTVFALLAEQ